MQGLVKKQHTTSQSNLLSAPEEISLEQVIEEENEDKGEDVTDKKEKDKHRVTAAGSLCHA